MKERVNWTINKKTINILNDITKLKGISRSQAVERAVEQVYKDYLVEAIKEQKKTGILMSYWAQQVDELIQDRKTKNPNFIPPDPQDIILPESERPRIGDKVL